MRLFFARTALIARACCATPLLAGCASDEMTASLQRSLDAVPDCCAGPREFRFEPAAIEQRVSFTIDARSPAHRFAHGKSRFKAFALPDAPGVSAVTVASFAEFDRTKLNEWNGRFFLPIVIFYDAGFTALRTAEGPGRFMFDSRGRRFSAFAAPVPPAARYFAVSTDARRLGTTLSIPADFVTEDTRAIPCDPSGPAPRPVAGTDPMASLCGLLAGYSIYAPPQTSTWNATIPYSAGGNVELWLSRAPAAQR